MRDTIFIEILMKLMKLWPKPVFLLFQHFGAGQRFALRGEHFNMEVFTNTNQTKIYFKYRKREISNFIVIIIKHKSMWNLCILIKKSQKWIWLTEHQLIVSVSIGVILIYSIACIHLLLTTRWWENRLLNIAVSKKQYRDNKLQKMLELIIF